MTKPDLTHSKKSQEKPFFTIHLGSPSGKKRLDEHDRVSAIHKINQKFDTFTLVDGKGFRDGQFEDTLLIHIATNRLRDVAELAHVLLSVFGQNDIGIAFGGHMIVAQRSCNVEATFKALEQLKKSKLPAWLQYRLGASRIASSSLRGTTKRQLQQLTLSSAGGRRS